MGKTLIVVSSVDNSSDHGGGNDSAELAVLVADTEPPLAGCVTIENLPFGQCSRDRAGHGCRQWPRAPLRRRLSVTVIEASPTDGAAKAAVSKAKPITRAATTIAP